MGHRSRDSEQVEKGVVGQGQPGVEKVDEKRGGVRPGAAPEDSVSLAAAVESSFEQVRAEPVASAAIPAALMGVRGARGEQGAPSGGDGGAAPAGAREEEARTAAAGAELAGGGVHHFRYARTRSGHSGFVLAGRAAPCAGDGPPRWHRRARASFARARANPEAALREVLEHYLSRDRVHYTLDSNEEEVGWETMLRVDAYSERFVGPPRRSRAKTERAVCMFGLQYYRVQGYVTWM